MAITPGAGLLVIRHAVENASNEPITEAAIAAILRGEAGAGPHVRAVFGDVSLQAITDAGAGLQIGMDTILAAYRAARHTQAAANPELDAALDGGW